MSHGYLESVILGEKCGLGGWIIRALLWPFSMLYRVGLAVYLWLYDVGIRKREKLSVPVISTDLFNRCW